ncbi:MAG: DUF4411 family protein [Actinobacteria bacterium]|nr:DUF4411 family protein [Actinomycetota bacterium]
MYPPDILPSLWNQYLPDLILSGHLRATDEVRIELERQDDEILEWAQEQSGLFVTIDEEIQQEVTDILAGYPKLIDPMAGRSGADPFIIALARLNGCTVVTEERPRSMINPRIPDVCSALDVHCINLLAVIRFEGWVFS